MKIDGSLKVMTNKHASSTSAVQQMADVGRQFAIMKAENKTTTSVNLPSGFVLNGQLEYDLDHLHAQGVLTFKPPEKKPPSTMLCPVRIFIQNQCIPKQQRKVMCKMEC